MNFISVKLYHKLLNHALNEGLDPQVIAHLPQLDQVRDNSQAVPADLFFELHELADIHLPAGCSVRVGQEMKMDDYGVLGMSWKTCAKAGEIFERSERYFKLLSDTYVFKVKKEEEVTHIYLLREAHRRGVELSNEATFSATVVVLQAMTNTKIRPIGVSFKHLPPREMQSYEAAFACPLHFKQDAYCISYRSLDLETRTAKADQSIHAYFLERIEEETQGIEIKPHKLAVDVKNLIKDALPSGIPSLGQLGEHLGMSSRTLTRRLSENGLSFRDLIHQTQQEISVELLKKSSRSVGEIAFLTGFSEQSAFNRAFKRWTGQSPVEFRKVA